LIFNILKFKKAASRKMDRNCRDFAKSRWEMILKAIVQPLGTAERVWKSHWEMPKGY
jgi:hypothetical protein